MAQLVTPTPIDLGTLGDPLQHSVATGVNDAHQVVGWSETPSGVVHAFLWQNGVITDLGTPNGESNYATAISSSGQIVGYTAGPAGTQHPWVWRNGQYTYLPKPTGTTARATAIEPGGNIAGCVERVPGISSDIVRWDPTTNPPFKPTVLATYSSVPACATGIDPGRRVTLAYSNSLGAVWRAGALRFPWPFLAWTIDGLDPAGTGRMTGGFAGGETGLYWPNLDLAPGIEFTVPPCGEDFANTRGLAVNRLGEVVGSTGCILQGSAYPFVAFYWATEGEALLLPPLSGTGAAFAYAINTQDEAVGESTVLSGASHATLWAVVPEVNVVQLPPCSPRPCRVPPKVSYIPKKFINDGILSRPGFDATQLDPNLITLGDGLGHVTRIARTATGAPIASIADVDGDGDLDLSVSFSKAQLIADGVLTPTTRNFEVSAVEPTGLPWTGHYPVWVK